LCLDHRQDHGGQPWVRDGDLLRFNIIVDKVDEEWWFKDSDSSNRAVGDVDGAYCYELCEPL
jgi:hypothetical protein